jgi:hypothetical protein
MTHRSSVVVTLRDGQQEGKDRTAAYCSDCGKWFSTDSFHLALSMDVLVADELRHEACYPLSEEVL